MTDKKDEKVKIEVSTYNWGPCVVKVKILDDFKKILLEEAKKNEEDYASKLAGQIRKETGYSEESRGKIIPYLSPYLGVYDVAFQRYQNKEYEFGKPEYALTALWCNYQRQYEFNPPHDHDGKLSFVIYLSIPDPLKKENKEYKGKNHVDLEEYSLCMVKGPEIVLATCHIFLKKVICLFFLRG